MLPAGGGEAKDNPMIGLRFSEELTIPGHGEPRSSDCAALCGPRFQHICYVDTPVFET